MARQAPQIRAATPFDAAELLELWAVTSPRGGASTPRTEKDTERALAVQAVDPDQRMLVAESEGRIVAAMKLSRGPLTPLASESTVHTSFLLVLPQFRRHGYGRALMEAAVEWAEEKDISQMTAITDGNRETNRFFARLGLATLGTVRHSSVAGLRKKLTAGRGHRAKAVGNHHLVDVIAQRRLLRRRQAAT